MKNRWLDRPVVYGLYLTLCTTQEMFEREFKRLTRGTPVEIPVWCKPGRACVHTLDHKSLGGTCQIVCIDAQHERFNGATGGILVATCLAHEATHCKQALMREIREHAPSDEFEAYTVQNIVQNLLEEYRRQVFPKGAT